MSSFLVGGYGLTLYAQQKQQGLTPPSKPSNANSTSDPDPQKGPAEKGDPFVVGERLVYNVSLTGFPTAARIETEVTERGQFFGLDSYQIRTKIESLGQVRSLFGELDNQYTTYVVPKTALPHRIVTSIRQGQAQSEETVILDQPKKQAIFDDKTLDLSSATYDLTSLAFGLRMEPMSEGEKRKFTILSGKELIEGEAIAGSRERIQTQAGAFSTLHVRLLPKKKYAKHRVHVWFSDDARRLPVLVTTTLAMGEARAEIASIGVTIRTQPPLALINQGRDESGNNPILSGNPEGPGSNRIGKGNLDDPNRSNVTPKPLPPEEIIEERNYPFGVGERLNYDISWGNFASVGKASFEIRRQGMIGQSRVFEFFGEATSTGAARNLVTVNDQIRSFAKVENLLPVSNDLRLREGRRLRQVSATYDWSAGKAILSSGTSTDLRPGSLDLISLFYSVRASDLKIGGITNYPFLDANHRQQAVAARVNKQETINSSLGTRDALQVDVLSPDGKLLLAQVWISNDSRRIPLYFVTRTRFGELRFQLTGATNTK